MKRFLEAIEEIGMKLQVSVFGGLAGLLAIVILYDRGLAGNGTLILGLLGFVAIDISFNSIKRRLDRIEKALDKTDRDEISN